MKLFPNVHLVILLVARFVGVYAHWLCNDLPCPVGYKTYIPQIPDFDTKRHQSCKQYEGAEVLHIKRIYCVARCRTLGCAYVFANSSE